MSITFSLLTQLCVERIRKLSPQVQDVIDLTVTQKKMILVGPPETASFELYSGSLNDLEMIIADVSDELEFMADAVRFKAERIVQIGLDAVIDGRVVLYEYKVIGMTLGKQLLVKTLDEAESFVISNDFPTKLLRPKQTNFLPYESRRKDNER